MDWRDHAAQVKPAEDRLIDRYRQELFRGTSPAPDRGYETTETPWGPGRQFFSAMHVTGIQRRSAWPETQMVLDMFWDNFPDRHFVVLRAIWPPDHWLDGEPPYNDVYWFNLAEHIATRGLQWLRVQPGPLVHFIWSNTVDLQHPPADGDPPPDLVAARREINDIKSGWLGPPNFGRRGS
jgi:hypothetical protein